MAHTIEVAKSGRAGCRSCKSPIPKGELRFGEETPNQFGDAGEMTYRWHHIKCAASKLPTELRAALTTYEGEVPDRAELERLMAEAEANKPPPPPPFPYADRAPTGRARCLGCSEAIAKGALRVAIERELERGMGVTKGAGYLHPRARRPTSRSRAARTTSSPRSSARTRASPTPISTRSSPRCERVGSDRRRGCRRGRSGRGSRTNELRSLRDVDAPFPARG